MLLEGGLVLVSDSRTNAGVDRIATFRKMSVWEEPGERFIALMTAGNLAVSQAVVTMLREGMPEDGETMAGVPTMTAAARLVGRAVREVDRVDGPALRAHGSEFAASFILGGQIKGRRLRLFNIYAAGNFVEATAETPYFQIGETKYGKPIIDRVVASSTGLVEAAKCALISMDSSMRSNLSVGPPIDLVIYERDALQVGTRKVIEESDPYFNQIRKRWSDGLRMLFATLPDPEWE